MLVSERLTLVTTTVKNASEYRNIDGTIAERIKMDNSEVEPRVMFYTETGLLMIYASNLFLGERKLSTSILGNGSCSS